MVLMLLFAACTGPTPDDTAAAACDDTVGNICTWAGTGDAGFDGGDNDLLASMFYWPMDVEFSPYGDPIIIDWNNHKLRLVEDDGTITTIMGNDFVGDGPADLSDLTMPGAPGTTVSLNHPTDVIYLPDGTLVSASWHTHKIRTWDPATGNVHVHCGLTPGFVGEDYAPAVDARFAMPKAVDVDAEGNLYIIDMKNQRVRVLTPEFTIATIAGNGTKGYAGDGAAALEANLSFPTGAQPEPGGAIALGPDGKLYVADTENHRIRVIDLEAGTIDTVAGNGTPGFGGDGGAAVDAMLNFPRDLEFDTDGSLWVADTDNHAVRRIDLAAGTIGTEIGTNVKGFAGDGAPATEAQLDRPFGIEFGNDGNVYVTDTYNHRIRVVYR
ncbi:MAG: SMP-30/gluconolactonase/LRE family protein [Pseudomonadota bacterium]|nr:SMP-30/gluconolactonase/LRE family protein [Pseudomonadota bacterium]